MCTSVYAYVFRSVLTRVYMCAFKHDIVRSHSIQIHCRDIVLLIIGITKNLAKIQEGVLELAAGGSPRYWHRRGGLVSKHAQGHTCTHKHTHTHTTYTHTRAHTHAHTHRGVLIRYGLLSQQHYRHRCSSSRRSHLRHTPRQTDTHLLLRLHECNALHQVQKRRKTTQHRPYD